MSFLRFQSFGVKRAVIAFAAFTMLSGTSFAQSTQIDTSRDAASDTGLPCALHWHYEPMSLVDKARYHGMLEAVEKGDWKRYSNLLAGLENQALIGRVQAEKLLHPWKYRSEARELVSWLTKYADHPRFNQVYKLAKLRVPPSGLKPIPIAMASSSVDLPDPFSPTK